ncbi:MAG: lipoprotein [Gammaproteobacteria bacterium]|nr:lipoprotein [Gammaproteobacteria bacterium]
MPDRILAIASVLTSLALLVACGQKGPLFLPGDPSQISTTIPSQSVPRGPADDQPDDDESEDDGNPERPRQ